MLLDAGIEYAILGPDVVADVKALLSDLDAMQEMADRALERSLGINTYDHRVDELFQIADEVAKRDIPPLAEVSAMAELIRRDAEVQKVVQFGAPELAEELPDPQPTDDPPPRTIPAPSTTTASRLSCACITASVMRCYTMRAVRLLLRTRETCCRMLVSSGTRWRTKSPSSTAMGTPSL